MSTEKRLKTATEALEKIANIKFKSLELGEEWYDRLCDAATLAREALSILKDASKQGEDEPEKSCVEIIKERYPSYNPDMWTNDIELNGDAVIELMEKYASQFQPASKGNDLEPEVQDNRCEYEKFVEKYFGLDSKVPENTKIYVEYYQLVSMLAMFATQPTSKPEKGMSDAVEFADWVSDNLWIREPLPRKDTGKIMWAIYGDEDKPDKLCTTEQLYNQFKNR